MPNTQSQFNPAYSTIKSVFVGGLEINKQNIECRFERIEIVENIIGLIKLNPDFKLIQMSTSLVFNGNKEVPYVESDSTNPINIYGKHKQLAERLILDNVSEQSAIYRFGSLITNNSNHKTTFNTLLRKLDRNEKITVESGRKISICNTRMIKDALISSLTLNKTLHLSHLNQVTWAEIVELVKSHKRSHSVVEITPKIEDQFLSDQYAPRPTNTSLASNVNEFWKQNDWKKIVMKGINF